MPSSLTLIPSLHVAAPAPSIMSSQPIHSQHGNVPLSTLPSMQQVIPGPSQPLSSSKPPPTGSMLPPPPPSQLPPVPSLSSSQQLPIAPNKPVVAKPVQVVIAQRPLATYSNNSCDGSDDDDFYSVGEHGDKKQLKRAANRRSAQLSRKRKKQFIEELKEENDELRRKEAILRSIPDLIVVFDSAGKLWFVSHSVNRFLDFSPSELQGLSFWDRLCPESVRLLKAAFMDALAARKSDMDTAPLGTGVWELRLVDKDGSHKIITLNGVVHFSGDAPECVCSIRPRDEAREGATGRPISMSGGTVSSSGSSNVAASVSASSDSEPPRRKSNILANINPGQSVMNSGDDSSVRMVQGKAPTNNIVPAADRAAVRISDADSGSVVSESGSDE
jgi:PAS domain S-box-containing protein